MTADAWVNMTSKYSPDNNGELPDDWLSSCVGGGDAAQYLLEHDVGKLIVGAVHGVAASKPQDPARYLSEYFGTRGGGGGGAGSGPPPKGSIVDNLITDAGGATAAKDGGGSGDSGGGDAKNDALLFPKHAAESHSSQDLNAQQRRPPAQQDETTRVVQAYLEDMHRHLVASVDELNGTPSRPLLARATIEFLEKLDRPNDDGSGVGDNTPQSSWGAQQYNDPPSPSPSGAPYVLGAAPAPDNTDNQSTAEESEAAAEAYNSHIADGVTTTLTILGESLRSAGKGVVDVQVNVTEASPKLLVQNMVEQFRSLTEDVKNECGLQFQSFPVRKKSDEWRGMVSETHMILWARMCVSKEQTAVSEAKTFEIFVNVLGYVSSFTGEAHASGVKPQEHTFDYFEIIPSFGELQNVQRHHAQHKTLCSSDTIVTARSFNEAIHHFKLSLVRVGEHIMSRVMQGEFLDDVARRMSSSPPSYWLPPPPRSCVSADASARRESVCDAVDAMRRERRTSTTPPPPLAPLQL